MNKLVLFLLPAAVSAQAAAASAADIAELKGMMSAMWLIMCGVLVMFMQAGFAMLESGCARNKNVQSVLMKNMIDIAVGTLGWMIMGFSFAYTGGRSRFIGGEGEYFLMDIVNNNADGTISNGNGRLVTFFFQWAFCATAATIVSGGVMERVNFWSYCIYTLIMTAFIYPIVVNATWNYGCINDIYGGAYIDFAGSGVVHLTGGVGALVGAIILGPRIGRFEDGVDQSEFDPHSMSLVVLGTLILWMGWYGFNCGSTLAFSSDDEANLAALVAANTTVCAASCAVMVFIVCSLKPLIQGKKEVKLDLTHLCNGVLAGLVSITAGCGNVQPYSAMVIGFIGAFVYLGSSMLLIKLKIDDPLGAFPVHGACGMWGVWAAALFDFGVGFDSHHGWSRFSPSGYGTGESFAANTAEIAFIWAWVGGLSFVVFFALHKTIGLRVDPETEQAGCDTKFMTMYAYRSSMVIESPKEMLEVVDTDL